MTWKFCSAIVELLQVENQNIPVEYNNKGIM